MQDKIKSYVRLEELLKQGYELVGPRPDTEKNLRAVRGLFNKGLELVPETWFEPEGFEFVGPNPFTKGFKLAFKSEDSSVEQYFKSKYSLLKDGVETPLYLLHENPV